MQLYSMQLQLQKHMCRVMSVFAARQLHHGGIVFSIDHLSDPEPRIIRTTCSHAGSQLKATSGLAATQDSCVTSSPLPQSSSCARHLAAARMYMLLSSSTPFCWVRSANISDQHCGQPDSVAGCPAGHFTQLVWKSSSLLGCAAQVCTKGIDKSEPFFKKGTLVICR